VTELKSHFKWIQLLESWNQGCTYLYLNNATCMYVCLDAPNMELWLGRLVSVQLYKHQHISFIFLFVTTNLTHLHVRQERSTKLCIMSSLFDSHWHSVNYLCDAKNHGFVRTDTPLAACVSEIHYTVFSFVSIPEIKIYTGLPHGSTDNHVAIVGGESHWF